jgi:hypothetical protein
VARDRAATAHIEARLFSRLTDGALEIALGSQLVALGERPLSSSPTLYEQKTIREGHEDATIDLMMTRLITLERGREYRLLAAYVVDKHL